MMKYPWYQCLSRVFIASLVVGLSACDSSSPESVEDEAVQPSEQVTIPPRVDRQTEAESLPAFGDIPAGPQRKEVFFDYLEPIVWAINEEVLSLREALLALEQQLEAGETLSEEARDWLSEMSEHYRADADKPAQQVAALKRRIDIIPASLALSQGALESA